MKPSIIEAEYAALMREHERQRRLERRGWRVDTYAHVRLHERIEELETLRVYLPPVAQPGGGHVSPVDMTAYVRAARRGDLDVVSGHR